MYLWAESTEKLSGGPRRITAAVDRPGLEARGEEDQLPVRPAREVGNEGWEIGWLPDNEYNDFACLQCGYRTEVKAQTRLPLRRVRIAGKAA